MRLAILALTLLYVGCGYAAGDGFANSADKVFAEAKKSGKPVLIDFFGIWCPPCNELDENVFSSTAFHEKSKRFHLLKLDADQPDNWKVKDRYKVGGYPTIIFTTSTGEEIYRIVGYRSPEEFLRVMDMVLAARNQPINKACGSDTADALWRCALVCTERKDNACAEKAYHKLQSKLKPSSARYQLARAYFVERMPNPELRSHGYERLLADLPDSPQALIWSLQYLELFEGAPRKPKQELIEKVLQNYPKLENDPRREELGISNTDMVQMRAELLEKTGKEAEAKQAWKEAAALLEKSGAQVKGSNPERGYTLERISALENAGELESALKLANDYRQKYPDEFTFHYCAAGILERSKKYNDALPIARKAYETSYGDNRIRVATLLIGLLGTVPDKAGARKIYDEVKKEYKPDAQLEVRTHRYLKKLDEKFEKLGAA